MIIDFHTHTFPSKISRRVVEGLAQVSRTIPFTDGSTTDLVRSMKEAGVDYSVNLPVMTSADQVEKINDSLIAEKESLYQNGIITFGGLHPEYANYKNELRKLKEAGIAGIKLHPTYQKADLTDLRIMRIIDAASEAGLATMIHAGWDIGIYDHDYASVSMILKVLEEIRPEKFILAHFGGWLNWKEVESYLAGAPVWLDSAFTVGIIHPNPACAEPPFSVNSLDNESFLRISRKHGTDRVLFATDSPWMDQKEYVQLFASLPLTETERAQIMHGNAEKLLGLSS